MRGSAPDVPLAQAWWTSEQLPRIFWTEHIGMPWLAIAVSGVLIAYGIFVLLRAGHLGALRASAALVVLAGFFAIPTHMGGIPLLSPPALLGFLPLGFPSARMLELVVFAGTSLALTTLARPVLKRRLHTAHVPTNVDALVGDKAIVVHTVDAHGGKIKLRGELWSARAFDETEILEPGRAVTVMTISGATAVVLGEPS